MVPPLPKEASVIRHTSVRGLKRQSDERKRDRESGQYVVNGDYKVRCHLLPVVVLILCVFSLQVRSVKYLILYCSLQPKKSIQSNFLFNLFWFQGDLRSYLSEPELPGVNHHNIGSDTDYQYFSSKGI